LQHGGLAREFEGAVGGGVTAYPDAEEVANAPASFGVALGRLNFLVIDRKVVDGVTDLQIQIAAGIEFGGVGSQSALCGTVAGYLLQAPIHSYALSPACSCDLDASSAARSFSSSARLKG
jgi:hypothetical protein